MSAATLLLRLYPPAWRRRYGAEFAALLEDTGVGARQAADVLPAAALAWLRPAGPVHDRAGRMRATVGVTLFCWVGLVAGAVVLGQLAPNPPARLPAALAAGSAAGWLVAVRDTAAALSVLAVALGGAPLAVTVLRSGRGAAARLAAPLPLVPGFLAVALAVSRLAPRQPHDGIGAGWFVLLAALGVLAGIGCAAGPVAAVHRVRADGTALTVAVLAGAAGLTLVALSAAAGLGYALVGHRTGVPLAGFAAVTAILLAAGAVSGSRGLRAALA